MQAQGQESTNLDLRLSSQRNVPREILSAGDISEGHGIEHLRYMPAKVHRWCSKIGGGGKQHGVCRRAIMVPDVMALIFSPLPNVLGGGFSERRM